MDSCFVCLEQEGSAHPYKSLICKCKGSLQLHTSCYTRLRGTHSKCPNCKTPYPDTDVEYEDGLPVKVLKDAEGQTHRYTYDEQNEPHGNYKVYYPCGRLAATCTFDHGMPVLIARKWNTDGVLVERCSYLDGKLNSYYYRWGNSGELLDVQTYYNGQPSGRHYIFMECHAVKIQLYSRGKLCPNFHEIKDVFELPPRICVDWRDAEAKDLL
jgi:hypothetical protein